MTKRRPQHQAEVGKLTGPSPGPPAPQGQGGVAAGLEPPLSVRLRRRRRGWGIALNLTPMIDVVFLLLFFFLAITRFGAIEGMLPAKLPGRAVASLTEVPRTPIRVRLVAGTGDASGTQVEIEPFGVEALTVADLTQSLGRIRKQEEGFDTDTPVHLYADDSFIWDDVVDVYNACLAANYERIYFVSTP